MRMANKMTKRLLPRANKVLVKDVASALVIKDLITNGRAIKIPSKGVNKDQKAQRFQMHQYQTVAVGFKSRIPQIKRCPQLARGVLTACQKAQNQKNIKITKDRPNNI